MAMGTLHRLRLCLLLRSAGVARALGSPLIGHDGRIIACSGKNLVAFERNGSVAWIIPLGRTCKEDISPVAEREEVTSTF
ncbi:hypothetical protein E2562_008150 [Oryza meyeriana var. granulata]|uniref:Uncharacterized protein n=1 Tax=Oryza meyeriana var. granulata TaxID=110450 RepID=A0A6G1CG21_9ORYZ|nr:hypothetical protein E2562_008150 [Oryza meyeriana var. granulata]